MMRTMGPKDKDRQDKGTLKERTKEYWRLSSAWRGRFTTNMLEIPYMTMEQLLHKTRDVAGFANIHAKHTLEQLSSQMLDDVIRGKRCRKTKAPKVSNVTSLEYARKKKQLRKSIAASIQANA